MWFPIIQNASISSLILLDEGKLKLHVDTTEREQILGEALRTAGGTPDKVSVLWLPEVEAIKSLPTGSGHNAGLSGQYLHQGKLYHWCAIQMADYRPRVLPHEFGHRLGLVHTQEFFIPHLVMAATTGSNILTHQYGDKKRFYFDEKTASEWLSLSPSSNEGALMISNAQKLDFCNKLPCTGFRPIINTIGCNTC